MFLRICLNVRASINTINNLLRSLNSFFIKRTKDFSVGALAKSRSNLLWQEELH